MLLSCPGHKAKGGSCAAITTCALSSEESLSGLLAGTFKASCCSNCCTSCPPDPQPRCLVPEVRFVGLVALARCACVSTMLAAVCHNGCRERTWC